MWRFYICFLSFIWRFFLKICGRRVLCYVAFYGSVVTAASHTLISPSIVQLHQTKQNIRPRILLKVVGAECRHNMRPSVQLTSVSRIKSKFGHCRGVIGWVCTCSRRLNRPAPGPPHANKRVSLCRYATIYLGFWHRITLTSDHLKLKIAILVNTVSRNIRTNSVSSKFFLFLS